MVEYCSKGSLGTKPQMRFPFLQRTVILTLVMISSFYICLFCLNQQRFRIGPNVVTFDVGEEAYNHHSIATSEPPRLHYPKPRTYTRNECAHTPVRFFAIISMQRSGSGWFETLLNSHINISSNGEIFLVKERRRNVSTIMETLDKVYNLDWYSSASKNECTGAVGLKWMLNQGLMHNPEYIVDYFKQKGVSSIFLFRRNLLRRLVSLLANSHDRDAKQLNGTHKAHVHSRHEAEVLARFKPLIDVKNLIPDMNKTIKCSTNIIQYFKGTRHIVLYYEDLVRNQSLEVEERIRSPRRTPIKASTIS
ncbi:uncharacterized protein LOC110030789 isoform X2 [Phalaenopsis equestris]|uniref:uncharacterized protein LOC110030789 isoform X2 n=1 Tax=Phalaenopsis equestris TaxID=78828 RepID=UPI0009E2719A|nr:uncharacterized protein LOC110030789 isoform X2 [Phalaenopsis equestris]